MATLPDRTVGPANGRFRLSASCASSSHRDDWFLAQLNIAFLPQNILYMYEPAELMKSHPLVNSSSDADQQFRRAKIWTQQSDSSYPGIVFSLPITNSI